ncbi:PA domain-containing protein [Marinilactibacillus piezotolerans]|jgi:hypothetical protein|uniref:Carboxypeptidase Q n=1 Tax=Marinilactibacillus piezotolerans TaxID=258723 RepID=A0A1I3X6N2_9LACT|nr:M28 family peptidase [Marinilactibacillus piezotolerans]SFK14541.1 PA domain-containing protein [Marinilactibacillus piezotolerans]
MINEQKLSTIEKKYINEVDSDYGFEVAKKLLEFKTNSFGFRTSGTQAEHEAAQWIEQEMKDIGLQEVTKESFPVDAWEFKGASVSVSTPEETLPLMEAGSFTCLEGTSPEGLEGEIIYVGDGTAPNYENVDVKDKIVLVDTDATHSFWYNTLFTQAEVRGAKAVIATVVGGAGTYKDDLITIHDILGKLNIPAVILNKGDGDKLRSLSKKNTPLTGLIKIDVTIDREAEAYYVHGKIIGKNPEKYIIIGGHYDAFWDGFQDNASSLGSQLTIAKAMIDSGYQPENTIIFVTNGAEESRLADTRYSFLGGAHAIVSDHPEWVSNTLVYCNFELTALDQLGAFILVGTGIYREALASFVEKFDLPLEYDFYEIPTAMADDIVFANAGVPTFGNVSVHWGGDDPDSFENYDHTQYDNVDRYEPEAFDFNNKIFGLLNIAFDQTLIAPFDFTPYASSYWDEIDQQRLKGLYSKFEEMKSESETFYEKSKAKYETILQANQLFEQTKKNGISEEKLESIVESASELNQGLLHINKQIQENIIKLNAFDSHIIGHTQPYKYVTIIEDLLQGLEKGDPSEALQSIQELDQNYMAQLFDKEVYTRVAIKAYDDSIIPQSWGTNQTLPFPDMYDVINGLMEKLQQGNHELDEEVAQLKEIYESQYEILLYTLDREYDVLRSINKELDMTDIECVLSKLNKLS